MGDCIRKITSFELISKVSKCWIEPVDQVEPLVFSSIVFTQVIDVRFNSIRVMCACAHAQFEFELARDLNSIGSTCAHSELELRTRRMESPPSKSDSTLDSLYDEMSVLEDKIKKIEIKINQLKGIPITSV